jgi:hypothetical protein
VEVPELRTDPLVSGQGWLGVCVRDDPLVAEKLERSCQVVRLERVRDLLLDLLERLATVEQRHDALDEDGERVAAKRDAPSLGREDEQVFSAVVGQLAAHSVVSKKQRLQAPRSVSPLQV